MGRRFRLAPPGEAELRQWFGMPPGQAADAAAAGAAGQTLPGEKPGFSVVASDACCRPAVGAVALAAAPAVGNGSPAGAAPASAAAAAAVLEAGGLFSVLQQRWPRHEPALHQRCAFKFGEPAAALLPGSLSYAGDPSSSSQGAGAAAAAELAAVTASGAVVALLPLPPQQAQQLLLLQRALARHPAAAPLSGGSHAAFRGTDGSVRQQPLFRHPLPLGATAAAVAPPSPDAAAAQQELALCFLVDGPAAPSPGAGGGGMAAARPGSAAGRAAGQALPLLAVPPSAQQQQQGQQEMAAVDAVLDADLVQHYLLLPPAEQQRLLAGALGCGSGGLGKSGEAEGLPQLAAQLSSLVAQLLL